MAASLKEQVTTIASRYNEVFGRGPEWIVAAPGRVNLVGGHIDYNGGYVLPMAIDRYLLMAAAPALSTVKDSGRPMVHLHSDEMDLSAALSLEAPIEVGDVDWSSYVRGVLAGCMARGLRPRPFDALIRSAIPMGSGLASSAALEVATATLVEAMCGCSIPPLDKALLCQEAERTFAGVPCGIMDQLSSIACEENALLLLDCDSRSWESIPLDDPEIVVLVADSGVKHALASSEYGRRREECEAASLALGVPKLCRATMDDLTGAEDNLDPVLFRRARHAISEHERTRNTANAIRSQRWTEAGAFMYASHESSRDDYEVSCKELDLLVALARDLGEENGVIGSRLTGAGFGGSTVSLVRAAQVEAVSHSIRTRYETETGITPTLFTTRPSKGAHRMQ